jgi:hypothetical protein
MEDRLMIHDNFIDYVVLFGLAGVLIAMSVLFISSILYYCITHNKGTLQYVIKTVAIGLITIPVAIILILVLAHYVIWQKVILTAWHCIFPPHKKTTINEIADIESAEVIVHLVHGTFEPNAPWTQSDSEMCKSIKKRNPKVQLSRFIWDGKNTVSSRKHAAHQLGEHIYNSPAKNNYIVAHSHGAAIVREMSYLRPDIAKKVQGVCLLSPPFIFRRKITRTSGSLLNLINISGALAIQFFLAVLLVPFELYNLNLAALIFFISIFFEIKISKKYKNDFLREVDNEKEQEAVDFRNVEIFHAIGDEADSGLRFVSSLHEWCFSIFSQLKKGQVKRSGLIHWSAILSYLFYIFASINILVFYPQEKYFIYVFMVSFILTVISHIYQWVKPSKDTPHVLLIAAIPVAIFSFWLALAKAIAYGDLRLIFCPEVFVATSETPVGGGHNVIKFAPQSDGMLIHSTHSHPQAIMNVAEWLSCSEHGRRTR